jgi:hypothetical protein
VAGGQTRIDANANLADCAQQCIDNPLDLGDCAVQVFTAMTAIESWCCGSPTCPVLSSSILTTMEMSTTTTIRSTTTSNGVATTLTTSAAVVGDDGVNDGRSSGLSGGAIAGIVISVLIIVAAVALLGFILVTKKGLGSGFLNRGQQTSHDFVAMDD